MPPARLQAYAFFITYSQSALTKAAVLEKLKAQGLTKRVVVGHEHHQDGNTHFHALVEYMRRKDVSTSHFDIQGEHPNIVMWTRSGGSTYEVWMQNHWRYCFKEDESPLQEGGEPQPSRKRSRDDKVLECLEVARKDGVLAAQEKAKELFASDYCKSVNSYDRVFMREANVAPAIPARPVSDFQNAPSIPENWRNLFLWGDTGHGKTQYARALLPKAVVVRHRDQLKDCRFSDGIIFDDFAVSHWPPTAVIALMDWDEPSGIDVKHGHVVISPHTRKIVCFNGDLRKWCGAPSEEPEEPRRGPCYGRDDVRPVIFKRGEEMTEEQYRAVRRRFTAVVHTTCPLFGEHATLTTDPPAERERGEDMPIVTGRAVDDYFMSSDYNQPE